jgi:hypothetical protein
VLLPESTKRAGSKAPRHEKSNSRAPPSFPLNGEKEGNDVQGTPAPR